MNSFLFTCKLKILKLHVYELYILLKRRLHFNDIIADSFSKNNARKNDSITNITPSGFLKN